MLIQRIEVLTLLGQLLLQSSEPDHNQYTSVSAYSIPCPGGGMAMVYQI
jgi:hypothetical protein